MYIYQNRKFCNEMYPATRFTDPLAAETWDSWFRWRDHGGLHDITIDGTWKRVASAIAVPNGISAPRWAARYAASFGSWRLLPDERLLQHAGRDPFFNPESPLAAVLNVAAFVTTSSEHSAAHFNRASFLDTAALAVHLLDDASLSLGGIRFQELRIGVIGFADALHRLRVVYDSTEAALWARDIGIALAEGCLRGAVDLGEERETDHPTLMQKIDLWNSRGMPASLVERASQNGVRYLSLTAIQCHPLLAKLANNTTDSIYPRSRMGQAKYSRGIESEAHEAIRVAIQPWIDHPIQCFG